jgi:DNA polymerase I-like protein with 3'-5' exonuclease and polymerase domains/uracil-DNA glycosylase
MGHLETEWLVGARKVGAKAQARSMGCLCDVCPLEDAEGPVLPEKAHGATFTVLGEAPGPEEIRNARPFVGKRSQLLSAALKKAGISRKNLWMQNSVMCQPPKNNMKKLLARIRTTNAARRKENNKIARENKTRGAGQKPPLALLLTPQECCRPGILHTLSEGAPRFILAMGKDAAKALLGGDPSIQAIRGSVFDGNLVTEGEKSSKMQLLAPKIPTEGFWTVVRDARIVPALSMGLVFAQRRWLDTLVRDIDRLVRWKQGRLTWKEPRIFYNPNAEALRRYLDGTRAPYTYDIETDGIVALRCNVRCIGIGTPDDAVVIGTRSRFTYGERGEDTTFYPPDEMERVKEVLREFFSRPSTLKIGHNAGYYDRLVIRQWLGVEPNPTLDTILLHRLAESELPHSLSFVGSKYTDVHSWKADRKGRKIATEAETDRELHHYCALDVAVTARVVAPLLTDVKGADQASLVEKDHLVQRVCADMHHVGMFVDLVEQKRAEKTAIGQFLELREKVRSLCGVSDLNPASTHQLRKILFKGWNLTPPLDDEIRFTATGDPSTGDLILRSLLSLDGLKKEQRGFIITLRKYRKVLKELGTYIVKLQPETVELSEIGWDDDEPFELRQERKERGYAKRGIVWADGRMRPGYNAHVTVTGRLSSSSPINAQNFPKHLRRLVIPQPGNVLVGADYDQLELRIAASRWNLKKYLQAFSDGLDPHTSVTALSVFGEAFTQEALKSGLPFPWKSGTKFKGAANDMRQLAKIIQYAYQYKASVETGARIIQSTEISDPDTGGTKLPYLKMPVRKVRQMRGNWLEGVPELENGWQREIQMFRLNHYTQEPVHGRKRFCLDGENPNEIVNFPIQGSASALVNDAMIAIWQDIPLHKWGPGTGLITQTHDSLVVECPKEQAQWTIDCINHHMNKTHPDLPGVVFTAEAEKGMTWKEVG